KMVTLPAGGDCRRKAVDDEAGQVYVAFPRFPTSMRSRIIGYVWDTTAPAGTIVQSESSSLVTYVVVRSGAANVGRWLTETRNVYEDYTRIYGEAPTETAGAVSVPIHSNDPGRRAESSRGPILFRAPCPAGGSRCRFIGAPRPAGPQPRDGLQRALPVHRRASAGGAPAPRRPAARTSGSSARLGRRGPSPATACSAHFRRGAGSAASTR